MKRLILVVFALAIFAGQAWAIDFWHSGIIAAPQGQCAATFTFDAGPMPDTIQQMQIVVAVQKNGKALSKETIEVSDFGGSEANRYGSGAIASADMCMVGLTISVIKATAIADGKKVDLLKNKMLFQRNFKPFNITIAGGKK